MIRGLFLSIAILTAPIAAGAQYVDVIVNSMNDGCPLDKYLGHVEEFRGVMKSENYSYTVEILQPLMGDDVSVIYWVGRTADLATFGAEYTRWEQALENAGSPESKVNAKLNECTTNVSRSGSLVR